MTDEEKIEQKIAEISATADAYPGVVIVHNVHTQSVVYMSKLGLDLLQTTLNEVRALGPAFAPTYFNPVESDEYMAQIWRMLGDCDFQSVYTFFQQVRTTQREGWSWYITSMRLLLRDEQGGPLLVIFLAAPIDANHHFAAKAQRLIDENDFLRRNAPTFARLTPREREVLQYLARGHSSPEIAHALHLSVQTAETHRRNIRQKLQATSAFELGQYARAFDLI